MSPPSIACPKSSSVSHWTRKPWISPLEMSGSQKNTSNLEPDTTVTDTSVGENGICLILLEYRETDRTGARDEGKTGRRSDEQAILGFSEVNRFQV